MRDGEEEGRCRRHAPQCQRRDPSSDEDYEDFPMWPKTLEDEWCGDFLPVEKRHE